MEKILPEYIIEGTAFYVDVLTDKLTEVGDADNNIAFSDMEYTDQGYHLNYDRIFKNAAAPFNVEHEDVVELIIPHKCKLDPAGMSKLFNLKESTVFNSNDFDLMMNEALRKTNVAEVFSALKIEDTQFTGDFKTSKLASVEHPNIDMHAGNLLGEPQKRICGFYDFSSGTAERVNLEKLSSNGELYFIEIGDMYKNHPLCIAIENKWNIKDMILRYPIENSPSAKIFPVKDIRQILQPAINKGHTAQVSRSKRKLLAKK